MNVCGIIYSYVYVLDCNFWGLVGPKTLYFFIDFQSRITVYLLVHKKLSVLKCSEIPF